MPARLRGSLGNFEIATRRADTSQPRAVQEESEAVFKGLFPNQDHRFITTAFSFFEDSFAGRYDGYQAIDTGYHDTEHTLLGALCLVNLFEGWGMVDTQPRLTPKMFELGLWAILLHDSGYLKRQGDNIGGGAKYTLEHVERSVSFCQRLLSEAGYSQADITTVQCMIRTTGLDADFAQINFTSDIHRRVGYAVCTADILGQMADDNYLAKLEHLHDEFREAAAFNGQDAAIHFEYANLDELLQRTPAFWSDYVWPRLNDDCKAMYRFLSRPYPDGRNEYLERIEGNLSAVRRALRHESRNSATDRTPDGP